ncbi:MAG: hypothetical protein V7739_01210 [Motiliproteus sp.]
MARTDTKMMAAICAFKKRSSLTTHLDRNYYHDIIPKARDPVLLLTSVSRKPLDKPQRDKIEPHKLALAELRQVIVPFLSLAAGVRPKQTSSNKSSTLHHVS